VDWVSKYAPRFDRKRLDEMVAHIQAKDGTFTDEEIKSVLGRERNDALVKKLEKLGYFSGPSPPVFGFGKKNLVFFAKTKNWW